jgi:peptide/nickel transport system permease protein
MLAYLGRSTVQKLVTLFFVSVISFLIIHLAPGEPSQIDPLNPKFTPEIVERMRKEFHLDKPLYVQYLLFYRDLFTGRIVSWKDNQPVLGKIWERFLNSLPLFIVGTLLTWTFSFPVGIRSAIHRDGLYDKSTTLLAYLLISIPGFFFAYIMIILVVTRLHVPVIGMETFGVTSASPLVHFMDRTWHLVLPSILGATGGIAVLSRYVRSQMLEIIGQDYVRTARAKGLSYRNRLLQARPAERAATLRHDVWPDLARTHRRFGDHRIHLLLARHGAHGLRSHIGTGLPHYPDRQLHHCRSGAPGHVGLRPPLHGGGPED